MQKWLTTTAVELGKGIDNREIDPVTLCETFLDAIDAHPHRDRIYARVTPGRAIAEATAAAARADKGHRLSPLDGVPISWKDLFDTAGIGTEAGSKLLEGNMPDRDATVLANATAMGLVCLGKTHMSELAFSGLGHNPSTASPPCVNDEEAVSGGSSSGAAASVAFGLAAAAIGSDTGGSVRTPAAWNDLVGLKTTSGRLPMEGVVPLAPKFDTIGPLCRSVADAAELLAAMEGRAPADIAAAFVDGRRFAVLETSAFDDIDEAPRSAFDKAVSLLEEAGAQIERIAFPAIEDVMPLSGCLYTSEAYGIWRAEIEANPDAMFSEILERFRLGQKFSAPDYVAAWAKVDAVRAEYLRATTRFDGVLVPTVPILPPKLDELKADHDFYVAQNLASLRNTRIGNLMGLAAVTLPTGTPSCGITIMCPPFHEEQALRHAAGIEEALAEGRS